MNGPVKCRFRVVALVALLAAVAGACTHQRATNEDLDDLLAAYRAQNERLAAQRQANEVRGIERFIVEVNEDEPGASRVSATFREALLTTAIDMLVEQVGLEYVMDRSLLAGRVSTRFEDRPLLEALDLILGPRHLSARLDGNLLLIERTGQSTARTVSVDVESRSDDGQGRDAGSEQTSVELELSHLTTARALEVLDGLFPLDENEGVRPVLFAGRFETNSVLLSGSSEVVRAATALLAGLDQHPGHVLLEALIVEFNEQSFLDLGSRIEDGATGELSNIYFDLANLVGDTISFTRVADAANTTSFTAILNLLLQEEDARVVSRPYLSTISGSPAELEVTEDRYVVAQNPDSVNVTLEEVSSGVTLNITPTITGAGMIRLVIDVAESQFIPSLENVEQRRSRSSVRTVTQVEGGQTVIIGGLMLSRRSESVAGIPYLRQVFPFSFFFGHRDETRARTQVMVFVTPHLWEPSMSTPMIGTDEFQIYPNSEAEKFRR